MPHSDDDGPVVKRQKVGSAVAKQQPPRTRGSAIFAPFRTVGLVSPTGVPFTSLPLGKTTFQITTSVGRSLQTYDLKRGLNLVFVTRPQTPADITATHAWKERVYAAWGDGGAAGGRQGLWVFQRGRRVAELELPVDLDQPVRQILIFGAWIVACARTRIDVWKLAGLQHYTTIHLASTRPGDNELSGGVCNMPTYLNKILVGRSNGRVEIWNVSTAKLLYSILPPAPDCGAVVCLEPATALDLVAVSYSRGPLTVHDMLRDRVVLRLDAAAAEDGPVTTMSFRSDGRGAGQDGRKDGVLATATAASGDVTFWDLNRGGRIMGVLRSAHNPPPSSSSSSSSRDENAPLVVGGGVGKVEFLSGQAVILTSGRDNSLKSWIFDETPYSPVPRILHSRSGHAAPVSCLQFLPSDFDGPDAGNKWLLSGGQDRSLWGWSLRRDGQSTELSQGHIRKKAKKSGVLAAGALGIARGPTTTLDDLKAPEITCMASSLNRDGGIGALPGNQPIWQKGRDKTTRPSAADAESSSMTGWESVVTGHKNDPWARTWFWGRKRAGRWAFQTGDGADVSAVAVSPCGTFALVGSARGAVDMFNLQSGLHRQRFPSRLTPAQARQLKAQQLRQLRDVDQLRMRSSSSSKPSARFAPGSGRHAAAVTGIVVDSLNRTVVTCSLDGTIKFWDFLTGNLVDEIDWAPMARITACRYHPASDLVAVSCDDGSVRVVDLDTKKTIRELWGGSRGPAAAAAINDLAFSSDGRWIVAASQDALLRVWDLPTSHLIDAFRLDRPCRAIAFSASGEYLAAAQEGELGVHIWTNRALFRHIPTRQLSAADIASLSAPPDALSAPTTSGEGGQGLLEAAFEEDDDKTADGDDDGDVAPAVEQLSADLMTLSLVPKTRWQTLLHLDLIRQRNKPTEAPKVPEKAPFFLPPVGAPDPLNPGHDRKPGGENEADTSRITRFDRSRSEQLFTAKLGQGAVSGDYGDFIEHLKALPPAAADLELRSLSPGAGADGPDNELLHFVRALSWRLAARRDYELAQAWMAVFLRLHFDLVVTNPPCRDALRAWRSLQERERARLDTLLGYCGGVVAFLRNPRT